MRRSNAFGSQAGGGGYSNRYDNQQYYGGGGSSNFYRGVNNFQNEGSYQGSSFRNNSQNFDSFLDQSNMFTRRPTGRNVNNSWDSDNTSFGYGFSNNSGFDSFNETRWGGGYGKRKLDDLSMNDNRDWNWGQKRGNFAEANMDPAVGKTILDEIRREVGRITGMVLGKQDNYGSMPRTERYGSSARNRPEISSRNRSGNVSRSRPGIPPLVPESWFKNKLPAQRRRTRNAPAKTPVQQKQQPRNDRSRRRRKSKKFRQRSKGPSQVSEETISKNRKAFETFYKKQEVCKEEEWDNLMKSLFGQLPTTFRIVSYPKREAIAFKKVVENTLSKCLTEEEKKEQEVISWYPDKLAYKIPVIPVKSKCVSSPSSFRLFKFFLFEDKLGNIFKMETVSMIPPYLLQVKSDHKLVT